MAFFGRTNCDLQVPYKLDPNPWKQHQNWLAIERWATYLTRNCLTGPADAYGQLAMCTPWELVAEADAYAQFDLARFGSGVTLSTTTPDQFIEVDSAGVWQVSAGIDWFWSSVVTNGTSANEASLTDGLIMSVPQQVDVGAGVASVIKWWNLAKAAQALPVSVTAVDSTTPDFYGTLHSGGLTSFTGFVRLEAQLLLGQLASQDPLATLPTPADEVEVWFVRGADEVPGSRVRAAATGTGYISVHLATYTDCVPGDEFGVMIDQVAGTAELWLDPDRGEYLCEESDDPCIGWDAVPPCEQAGVGQPCAVRQENKQTDSWFAVIRENRPTAVVNVEIESTSGPSDDLEIRPDMLKGTASASGLVVMEAGDKVRVRLVNNEPSLSFFYTTRLSVHRVSTDVPSGAGCGGGGGE